MSEPHEWLWGELSPSHLTLADAVAQRMLDNVKALRLSNGRYSHTPDERYQKLLGAEGEIAFRVLTGRPLPTVEAIASTWKGADVDRYAVKTISQPRYRLLFDDSDMTPVDALVLMLNQRPRFAIVGWIDVARALTVRTWGVTLPRPAWVIDQRDLSPWDNVPA